MYFENARKDKGVGAKMINPNDPEQNPDAFMCGSPSHEYSTRQQNHMEVPNKGAHVVQHHHKRYPNEEGEGSRSYPQKIRNHKNRNSESGSEISNSDHALIKSHRHPGRYGLSNKSSDSSTSSTPLPPGHATSRSGNNRGEVIPHRVASVPKFGAWDETDPKSGEGFTIIFNKVKEEKKIGAANLPKLPTDPVIYSSGHHGNSSSRSKICCCLFPRTDE
ncbi:RPM1-interacting protein 4-like isoform X2 [Tasmannia lanceolata]